MWWRGGDCVATVGVLSMARGADKNGARSSFSVLLGSAPHLDMEYAIFGWVG